MMLFLLACTAPDDGKQRPADDSGVHDTDSGSDTDSGGDTDSGADTGTCEPFPLPVDASFTRGFTGAEDFAFDGEGNLVSLDLFGNLVAIARDGTQRVIASNLTQYGAGTRFLPGGDLVLADAEKGRLLRIEPVSGGTTVVLTDLQYPNGLDVDPDGFVYVSEQITGTVRRVDPDSGSYTYVAAGLYNPNGVTFSPDYQTLYVGSFGAGVIWAVDRDGEGWSPPRVYATTPEAPGIPPDWCDTAAVGDECPLSGGYGLGLCESLNGDNYCSSSLDYGACAGLSDGDACTSTRFGQPISQTCVTLDADAGPFCPRTEAAYTQACEGLPEGAACEADGRGGSCYPSWEGVSACYVAAWPDVYTNDCEERADGDACLIDDPLYPSKGYCGDGTDWGVSGLLCWPAGVIYDEHGGLDGLNTDACGSLYTTEYIAGKIWRFDAEGAEAQLVADVRSAWIPNMHWGNGIGGWESDVLYVMDRERAGLFELELGVRGHPDAYGGE